LTARVSAASTISVKFTNNTGGTIDLPSGVLSVATRRIIS
jgi:spore coat protein U-like protein